MAHSSLFSTEKRHIYYALYACATFMYELILIRVSLACDGVLHLHIAVLSSLNAFDSSELVSLSRCRQCDLELFLKG